MPGCQADVNALLLFGTTRAVERYGGLGGAIAMKAATSGFIGSSTSSMTRTAEASSVLSIRSDQSASTL